MECEINQSKSLMDKKEYKVMHVGDLEVLLVSTYGLCVEGRGIKEEELINCKAAAGMCVQVGSFSDPMEAQGLAHFLEHMVFMGSEKYPKENGYDQFVTAHGGFCNAFTEGEFTVFQFDVTCEYFRKALDMFAQCLTNPLLKMEAAVRELNAIESEFQQASVADDVRLQQLFCHSAMDGHVVRKFGWGNKQSLDVLPRERGVDMARMLRSFWKSHYKLKHMKLVVVAPKKIEDLVQDVRCSFEIESTTDLSWIDSGDDKTTNQNKNKYKNKKKGKKQYQEPKEKAFEELLDLEPQDSILKQQLGKYSYTAVDPELSKFLTRVVPIKATHKLHLVWQIPSQQRDYRKKTALYIAHLLGHEGEGSIIAHLKHVGYASYLSAGCDMESNFDNNSLFSLFRLTINLTSKGLSNWPYVVDTVMRYVYMAKVQGPQEWIYAEIKKVAALDYDYLDEGEEEELAERLCVEMCPLLGRDRKELLPSNFLYYDFDPEAVDYLWDLLQPENMLVTLTSSVFKGNMNVSRESSIKEEEEEEELESDDDDEGSDGEDGGDEREEIAEELTPTQLMELYEGPSDWAHLSLPYREGEGSEIEPHFGTTFWTEPIPASVLALWHSSFNANSSNIDMYRSLASTGPPLHLPVRNEYIPDDLTIVAPLVSEEAERRCHSSSPESGWKLQLCQQQISTVENHEEEAGTDKKINDKGKNKTKNINNFSNGKKKKRKLLEVPKDPEPLRILDNPGLRVWHLVDPRSASPKPRYVFGW